MKHLLPTVIVLSGFFLSPAAKAENAFAPVISATTGPTATSPRTIPAYSEIRKAAALRSWKRSLIPLAVSQTLDITSSYGMRELNPLLAGPDGRFGPKATTIKIGTAAAAIGVEYLIVKKWPSSARTLAKLNLASSILTGTFAVHNYAIK
jgi:hypothetical protein